MPIIKVSSMIKYVSILQVTSPPNLISPLTYQGGADDFINQWDEVTYNLIELQQQPNEFLKSFFNKIIHYIFYFNILDRLDVLKPHVPEENFTRFILTIFSNRGGRGLYPRHKRYTNIK